MDNKSKKLNRRIKIYFLFFLYSYPVSANEKPCEKTFVEPPRTSTSTLSKPAIRDYKDILSKLSGNEKILYNSKLNDRYSMNNKLIVRSYLILMLIEYGYSLDSIFLEYKYHRFPISKFISSENDITELRNTMFFLSNKFEKILSDLSIIIDFYAPINLVVEKEGINPNQNIIEVSAHYDTRDNFISGADNNGTGITTLLQIMRYLRSSSVQNTVRGIFTDHGEKDFKGSEMHITSTFRNNEKILGAIVLDTIGYFPPQSKGKASFAVEASNSHQHKSQRFLNLVFSDRNEFQDLAIPRLITEKTYPETAEHGIYWKYNIPAVLISEDLGKNIVNPNSNTKFDTIEHINFPFYGSVSNQVIDITTRLAMTEFDDPILTTPLVEPKSKPNHLSTHIEDLKKSAALQLKTNLDTLLSKSNLMHQRFLSRNLNPRIFQIVNANENKLVINEERNLENFPHFENVLDFSIEFFMDPILAVRIGSTVFVSPSKGVIETQRYRVFRSNYKLNESLIIFDSLKNLYETKGKTTVQNFLTAFGQSEEASHSNSKLIQIIQNYLTGLHSNSELATSSILDLNWPNFPTNPESFKAIRNSRNISTNSIEDYKL